MTNDELNAIRRQVNGVVVPDRKTQLAQSLIIVIDQLREENNKLEAAIGNMMGHMQNMIVTINKFTEQADQAKQWVNAAEVALLR